MRSPARSRRPGWPSRNAADDAAGGSMSEAVRAALASCIEGRTLTLEEARLAMGAVMDGEATPAQLAALLVALRMRGETVEELAGFATAMRERVLRVEAPEGTIDVVGTGGDGSGTFNISTASALVVASTGVPVAKHGNRAITSRSGAADVLEALGVRIDHDADSAGGEPADVGFAFLFAPAFHPAMKHAGPTRREIGIRTAFNLIGPLTNPAGAHARTDRGGGCRRRARESPRCAGLLGTERTTVVHGDGRRRAAARRLGRRLRRFDGRRRRPNDRPGATTASRARRHRHLRAAPPTRTPRSSSRSSPGEPGPRRDVVLLNAGAALVRRPSWRRTSRMASRRPATHSTPARHGTCWRDFEPSATPPRLQLPRERPRDDRARAPIAAIRRAPGCRQQRAGTAAASSARSPTGASPIFVRCSTPWTRSSSKRRLVAAAGAATVRAPPGGARSPPDRRDQASVPVGGRNRRRRRGHRRPRPRLPGGWRRGDLRAVRAALVRRLGRGHGAGPSIGQRAGPRQGVRRRPRDSLPMLRAAGADAVLLLAVLHPPEALAGLVDEALELGLEPLVEAHDERELERALATEGARHRHQQPRPAHARCRSRARRPAAAPRSRGPARHRGVGRARRGHDPRLARRGLRRGARRRDARARRRPGSRGARHGRGRRAAPTIRSRRLATPFVKICGITDAAGSRAAVAAGADAIGLNLVPGTPRALSLDEAANLATVARSIASDRSPARRRRRSPSIAQPRT